MKNFSIKARMQSFVYAFRGLFHFLKNEHNAWLHLFATLMAIILGFVLAIDKSEWLFVILAIALVLTTEALNTAIEHLTDYVSLQKHPKAALVKDIAAGAVLISVIGSLVVGIIIFLPKFF